MTALVNADATKGAEVETYSPERWDDHLLLPQARLIGATQPTYSSFGTSLYGWEFAAGDLMYVDAAQFPHSWDFSPIRPHVHFSSNNGGTGNIVWEMIYATRSVSGVWSAELTRSVTWSGTLAAFAGSVADLWTGEGDAVANPGPSMLMKGRLRLVSKTFSGRVFLDGWDVHLRRNRAGTVGEFN